MAWNFKELANDVRPVWGDSQADDLRLSCTSLGDRWFNVRFHFQEAAAEIEKVVPKDAAPQDVFVALVGGLDDETRSFEHHRQIAAAHTVACLQSLHAISDTLAHVVCLGLGLNLQAPNPLELRAVNVFNVTKRLAGNPLSLMLEQFVEHDDHKYLSAVVNHSKHRSLVKTAYHVDLTGTAEEAHGLRIVEFKRDGDHHPARSLGRLLSGEYDRQQKLMQTIGAELNLQAHNARLAKGV